MDTQMVWNHLAGLVRELQKHPDIWYPFLSLEQVMEKVKSGEYQLWIGGRGHELSMWGLTEFFDYPHGKCIRVVWASGDTGGPDFYEKWCDVLDVMARELGAKFIEVGGRSGWERVYKPFGYKVKSVILMKEVEYAKPESAEGRANEQGRTDPGAAQAHGDGDGADRQDAGRRGSDPSGDSGV